MTEIWACFTYQWHLRKKGSKYGVKAAHYCWIAQERKCVRLLCRKDWTSECFLEQPIAECSKDCGRHICRKRQANLISVRKDHQPVFGFIITITLHLRLSIVLTAGTTSLMNCNNHSGWMSALQMIITLSGQYKWLNH